MTKKEDPFEPIYVEKHVPTIQGEYVAPLLTNAYEETEVLFKGSYREGKYGKKEPELKNIEGFIADAVYDDIKIATLSKEYDEENVSFHDKSTRIRTLKDLPLYTDSLHTRTYS